MSVTICTFLWGGWCRPFGLQYVKRLHSSIHRNASVPFDFVCFTDRVTSVCSHMGVEFAPLESPSMLGCLPKITAFNPSHGFSGQIFVFDLDSVVVGSLDRILSYQGEYCSKAVFHLADKGEWVLAGDLISFHPGMVADAVWSGFVSDPRGVEKLTRGYERFWYRDVFSRLDEEPDMWQKLYPGQFIGYKDHVRGKSLPDNARIVSMYERPKPHEINEQWLLENWR